MAWLALSLAAGLVGLATLLWRESRRRARAEREADGAVFELEHQRSRAATLARFQTEKDVRIAELETALSALDVDAFVDSVFGGVRDEGTSDPDAG